MNRRTTAYLYLLLVSVIWGAASPVVKYTLTWLDPLLFLAYRFAISTAIALPMLTISHAKLPRKTSDLWLLILTGVLSAPLTLYLFFLALDNTTALSGSLITATGPLLLVIGGMLLFREKITKNEKIGIGIALSGTLITIIGPLSSVGYGNSLGKITGNSLMMLAVCADTLAALMSKKAVQRGISPSLLSHSQFIIGLAILLPIVLIQRSAPDIAVHLYSLPLPAHGGVFFMALISGSIAYTFRNRAIKSIEVSESALFTYLQPLWAAILAVLWLKEAITPAYIIGGIIIAIGVIIAEYKRKRRQKKHKML